MDEVLNGMTHCYQINLQTGWGGGEVYTAFLTRALLRLGVPTTLFAHPGNPHWTARLPAECMVIPVQRMAEIAGQLAGAPGWLLFHTPAGEAAAAPLRRAGHFLSAIVHMPLYGRDPASLRAYDLVYAVSAHVIESLHAAGIHQVHAEPLWGVADLAERDGAADTPIFAASPYDWDLRKGRDRLLSLVYPLYAALRPKRRFTRAPGITLGLVSRLTPIKQFPLLFGQIVPVLARHPEFRLEIFGAGGYASVRDLRRALAPVRERVRYWGRQQDVGAAYRKLDYLLTGLPEKEALGLNILEAQACGTPVLAVNAPPFTETVADGVTGLFYDDPRVDDGASLDRLLSRLTARPFRIDPEQAHLHLEQFSEAAFSQRVSRLIEATARRMAGHAQNRPTSILRRKDRTIVVDSPKILVIRRDNIGDLVCTTPLLHALRRQLPQARIECLANRYNQAVLQNHPDIDALHAYTKAKHQSTGESLAGIYWQRLRMVAALRRQRFDWVILPDGGSASALRFARWVAGKKVLVRDEQDTVAGPHEVQQCCHLLPRMGLEYETPETRIFANEADVALMHGRLAAAIPFTPRRLIALHISARKPSQRWPAESFAELARRLSAQDAAFLLLWAPGSADNAQHPGDDEKAARVLELAAGLPIVPTPTRRLEELIAALSLCDAVICGDGGAMHVAAGLGKPIVCLFGQSPAARWHPWGPAYELLQMPSMEVKDITVDAVARAYATLLGG